MSDNNITGDETMTAATDTIKRPAHGSHQTRPDTEDEMKMTETMKGDARDWGMNYQASSETHPLDLVTALKLDYDKQEYHGISQETARRNIEYLSMTPSVISERARRGSK